MNIFENIPYFLFLVSLLLLYLYKKPVYLIIFVVGTIMDKILNTILKGWIQEPRPTEDKKKFAMEKLYGFAVDWDRYGMPSAHAQNLFFSTVFLSCVLKNKWITLLYLVLSLLCLYNRVYSQKKHSLIQVIVGSIIGSLVAIFFYHYGMKSIPKKWKMKQDDDAPI